MRDSAIAGYFGYTVEQGAIGARLRRLVIRLAIALLILGGTASGIIAGRAAAAASQGSRAVLLGVLAGIGGALASWLVAALLGLVVEIADSLRSAA